MLPQTISSKYHNLSSYYGWRPYLPNFPSIIHSPFKTPSNTTLQLENGDIDVVPANLKKTTPNFHLLMPAERDTNPFCKTTLSAMLLNYPPPTVVNLYTVFESEEQRELDTINSTLHYLGNEKLVQDEDLVLIVDGQQSWFQLPSDVIVTQYKRLLKDANLRLLKRYGVNEDGFQRFNQTIVFGAEKMCQSDDMACRYVPASILPIDTYGTETGRRIADMPAKFLNSRMVMGPAHDLRLLYLAALNKFEEGRSQSQTVQSVIATLFSEQQLRRDAIEEKKKPASAKFKELLSGTKSGSEKSAVERRLQSDITDDDSTQHEFSIGLDYAHTLFQPLIYCTEDELAPLVHDNSTDLSQYNRPDSWLQQLALPPALSATTPPFWRPDLTKHNPSPNEKPAYIDKLEFASDLDSLPSRNTPWTNIELIQNTYTGAVPAILLNSPYAHGGEHPPTANISWNSLWYSSHKRALLRSYFRKQQSSYGYHNSLVGGDRAWDMRGGRGGVWTEAEQIWLPWGEVDGVCGTLSQLNEVFNDGKGVWLHEKEEDAEQERLVDERALNSKIEQERVKEESRQRAKQEEMAKQKEEEKQAQQAKEAKETWDAEKQRKQDEERMVGNKQEEKLRTRRRR
jgi:hypothetical protein